MSHKQVKYKTAYCVNKTKHFFFLPFSLQGINNKQVHISIIQGQSGNAICLHILAGLQHFIAAYKDFLYSLFLHLHKIFFIFNHI